MKYPNVLFVFLLISISNFTIAQINTHLDKAIVIPANIDSIIAIEKNFATNDSTPPPEGESWFQYKAGKKNILIVAGHATSQTREGKIKQPDSGTGSLAIELNKLRDVPILYTTYLSPSDPNYYDDNQFKDTLSKIIDMIRPQLVIDLHVSHPYRSYDIDFGTLNGKSLSNKTYLLDSLINILDKNGIDNLSQDFYPGEKYLTITKFVNKKGIPCIQLEINSVYLSAGNGDLYGHMTAQLLQSLLRFIDCISRQ